MDKKKRRMYRVIIGIAFLLGFCKLIFDREYVFSIVMLVPGLLFLYKAKETKE